MEITNNEIKLSQHSDLLISRQLELNLEILRNWSSFWHEEDITENRKLQQCDQSKHQPTYLQEELLKNDFSSSRPKRAVCDCFNPFPFNADLKR